MNLNEFKNLPIVGILRGIKEDALEPLAQTIISSGLKTIEITMNTPNASKLINAMVKLTGERVTIGAGTVLSMTSLKQAINAGATFIVMPTFIPEVVGYCVKKKIPVFPGALTPQEIYNAWGAGATMVKVFPAKFFGPAYFREIKGPFDDIQLLACGGVTNENIGSFFDAGASAVAFGASIFKKGWLKNQEFFKIGLSIKSLFSAFSPIS